MARFADLGFPVHSIYCSYQLHLQGGCYDNWRMRYQGDYLVLPTAITLRSAVIDDQHTLLERDTCYHLRCTQVLSKGVWRDWEDKGDPPVEESFQEYAERIAPCTYGDLDEKFDELIMHEQDNRCILLVHCFYLEFDVVRVNYPSSLWNRG